MPCKVRSGKERAEGVRRGEAREAEKKEKLLKHQQVQHTAALFPFAFSAFFSLFWFGFAFSNFQPQIRHKISSHKFLLLL
jgi:hypothetical protein